MADPIEQNPPLVCGGIAVHGKGSSGAVVNSFATVSRSRASVRFNRAPQHLVVDTARIGIVHIVQYASAASGPGMRQGAGPTRKHDGLRLTCNRALSCALAVPAKP